jgi:hypothetical protein
MAYKTASGGPFPARPGQVAIPEGITPISPVFTNHAPATALRNVYRGVGRGCRARGARFDLRHSTRVGTAWACAALVVLVGGRLGAVGPVDDRADSTAAVQAVADRVRASLAIDGDVRVTIVEHNHRIASVQPVPGQPGAFLLSIQEGFLATLSAQELEAVIAHEMGHVWIYTHHPYLQTERLANRVAMRHVAREQLEQVYLKLWGAGAVKGSLASFLGHAPVADGRVAAPSQAQVAQE